MVKMQVPVDFEIENQEHKLSWSVYCELSGVHACKAKIVQLLQQRINPLSHR